MKNYSAIFVLCILCCNSVFAADEKLEYSEVMPLAESSLLLAATEASSRAVVVGERGHILLSEDRKNWRQPGPTSVPTRATLTDVTAIGDQLWAVGHDAVILHSSDGGENWQLQYSDPDLYQPLLSVMFTDVMHGYAGGAYGYFLQTSDGGKSWKQITIHEEFDFHINDILQLTDGSLFLVAEAGNAFLRIAGETQWQHIELPYAGSMFGGLVTAEGNIMVYGLRGHALETPDRGKTWYELKTGSLASIFGGTLRTDGSVVLVGAKGAVLTRMAGASDFVIEEDSQGKDLSSLLVLSPKSYQLVGEAGLSRFTSKY